MTNQLGWFKDNLATKKKYKDKIDKKIIKLSKKILI